jgi:hypothetical protein
VHSQGHLLGARTRALLLTLRASTDAGAGPDKCITRHLYCSNRAICDYFEQSGYTQAVEVFRREGDVVGHGIIVKL